ncbi:hypothetical protein BS50DRAFT_681362 [Corynespora cassiicola Philippines]|uniref:Uncharacterized protein n=1 Tax=Corynespora cassiicola Philippines TaxID=1448308 RepID=A0A2T2N6Y8_CORCC|nr:hypothetical protein BS50DRAFT_681362 [Corynespora cassiicola Philippines]
MAVLYKTLNIEISDYKAAVERWTTILERTHSWGTPQRVTIGARAASSTEIEHDMIKMGASRLRALKARSDNPKFEAQVLIDFLRKLPSLSDLEWQSGTPLVPPLVQFLRDQLPSCNLHLKSLKMAYDTDPCYIRSVLYLPSLQTIWLERKHHDVIQDVVQHILRAPDGNLRELRILWSHTGASPFGEPPIVWDQELVAYDGQRLGQLQSLQLAGIQGAEGTGLQTWARHTDFGQLRALSLEMPVTRVALETLINLPLQSLHSLGLVLDPHDTSDQYSAALQTFICNLPSLSHLRLTGALPSLALKAILDYLDSVLHTLYLTPAGKDSCRFVFDSSTIALVTDSCKHVQDLGIDIRRAWNKPGEDIAILKAIGRMPHLSSLDLTFNASDYALLFDSNDVNEPKDLAPSDPSFSAFDTEPFLSGFGVAKNPRKGHIRDALINSAIDAELAKAVFNTITSAAPDGETPSLQRLSLKAAGGGNFGTSTINGSIAEIVEEVGREWIVERSGYEDVLEVRRAEVDDEEIERSESLGWDVEPILRRVWPGDGVWFNEWQAFPLV